MVSHWARAIPVPEQVVMVVDVLVSQCQGEHALAHRLLHAVFDADLAAVVCEAPGEAGHDTEAFFEFAQEHDAGVRGDRSPVESGLDHAPSVGLKSDLLLATQCSQEVVALSANIGLKLKR